MATMHSADEHYELLKVFHRTGSVTKLAEALKIPRTTASSRLNKARERYDTDPAFRAQWEAYITSPEGIAATQALATEQASAWNPVAGKAAASPAPSGTSTPSVPNPQADSTQTLELRARIKNLENLVAQYRNQALDAAQVREQIFKFANTKPDVPEWIPAAAAPAAAPGVPILFGSDWHWGEVVKPSEIGGVNEYNLAIAQARLRTLVESTISLLTEHMVNPEYPGIIFALGGDMVSGNIHDELAETNDKPIMPIVMDLVEHLIAAILRLKQVFGRVYVPCVAGNHGRLHRKVRAKESNFHSFDWIAYTMAAMYFRDDPDVVFFIPDGPDALFQVYGHRYLLTHGNQFRGGDGMIGPIGPIIRGDHKKRSRNAQVDQEYDTLLIGHFHQLLQMQRVIVNGSMIGYNEYAYSCNFGYEPPQQALWITHPRRGITFSMPVHLEDKPVAENTGWVQWHQPKAA